VYKVGFIGLGRMGSGICNNIIKNGHDTVVFDTNPEAYRNIEERMHAAKDVSEVFSLCEITFLSLPGSIQVEETIGKFMECGVEGKTVIDLSTSYPISSRKIYELFKNNGGYFADSSLSGSPNDSANGNLLVFFGGDKEVYDRWLPLMRTFSREVKYVGASGSGNIAKLACNYLGVMYATLYAEIFPLLEKLGVDINQFYDIIGSTKVDCGVYRFYAPKIVNKTYDMGFSLELALKDITYVKRMFEEYEVPAFILEGGLNLLRTSVKDGKANKDLSECAATVRDYLKILGGMQ